MLNYNSTRVESVIFVVYIEVWNIFMRWVKNWDVTRGNRGIKKNIVPQAVEKIELMVSGSSGVYRSKRN